MPYIITRAKDSHCDETLTSFNGVATVFGIGEPIRFESRAMAEDIYAQVVPRLGFHAIKIVEISDIDEPNRLD